MKQIILLVIMAFCGQNIAAQEFYFDPILDLLRYESDNGSRMDMKEQLFSSSPYIPNNISLTINDEEGHEYFSLSEINGLKYERFESDRFATINNAGMGIFEKVGSSFTPVVTFDYSLGIVAYDNNQNPTVIIDGDVGGDGRVTTDELMINGGSDFAENFDVIDAVDLVPGMLVSISDAKGNLAITKLKRDKKVVGIVSGANGIETGLVMGQKGSIADGDVPVALSGRAYVYANTENGPIEAGDFLTSSSIAGYAMKVKNVKKAQGAIIGKAMTALEEGSGFVLVLVNLQ